MEAEVRSRLRWVRLHERTGDAGLVCRRCGISRPTLRKWLRRYQEAGIEGLRSRSRKPCNSPNRKVLAEHEALILQLRKGRQLGARRIQSELRRLHEFSLSLSTIHRVLRRNEVKPLKRLRRKKRYKRYSRPIPGDRIQMDTRKIAPGLSQYTALDDCTRYRVLGLYERHNAASTLSFLERVLEEMPFSIQRIQTDRGREFFAIKVQQCLLDWGIKFRPIKPGSPHLNGKVERSQKTDLEEFYSTVDLDAESLEEQLLEWQHYYNWHRPHGSLSGKSPMDRFFEVIHETPLRGEVEAMYDPSTERIQEQNNRMELALRRLEALKRCL
jgi:transposase InsO family protein